VSCGVPREGSPGFPTDRYYTLKLRTNASGQQLYSGDSGGPCFYGDKLVSIHHGRDNLGLMEELNAWSWTPWLDSI
jgi:hypothetical protein